MRNADQVFSSKPVYSSYLSRGIIVSIVYNYFPGTSFWMFRWRSSFNITLWWVSGTIASKCQSQMPSWCWPFPRCVRLKFLSFSVTSATPLCRKMVYCVHFAITLKYSGYHFQKILDNITHSFHLSFLFNFLILVHFWLISLSLIVLMWLVVAPWEPSLMV